MNSFSLNQKLVIGMVGLPARGKTYYATKINKYLRWIGVHSKYISTDHYRKKVDGNALDLFCHSDVKAQAMRDELEGLALEATMAFLQGDGDVVLYDGYNYTKEKRKSMKCILESSITSPQILWIECQSDNPALISLILCQDLKFSVDLAHASQEEALALYKIRLEQIESVYEAVEENEYPGINFVRMKNLNEEVTINNVTGYLPSRLLSFVINLRVTPHPIYLLMHGETKFTASKTAGCDPELTLASEKYAEQLGAFLGKEFEGQGKPTIFTSSLKRTAQTALRLGISGEYVSLKVLDDIDYGVMDGFPSSEIFDYLSKSQNPLKKRFPQGECYLDVIDRLEPLILEIERSIGPVVVVGHRSVLRCVYSFFSQNEIKYDLPFIDIPLNSVIKLVPETHSCEELWLEMNSEGEMMKIEPSKITSDKLPQPRLMSRLASIGPITGL